MLSLIFVLINARSSTETLGGWAIPAATDIACVLAVLAVVGSRLPAAVRTILLTPAVVDDLIAIIAVFYTSSLQLHYLLPLLVPIVAYAFVVRRCELLLSTGIHATIAGVVWAFMVSVSVSEKARDGSSPWACRYPRASPAPRFRGADLDPSIAWSDVIGIAALVGIGFTESLLIAELSCGVRSAYSDASKIAILTGLVIAAVIGAIILGLRHRAYARWESTAETEEFPAVVVA